MSLYIPKVIYMCHKSLRDIRHYSKNWANLNPDFEIKLYNDNTCREFLKKEFPHGPHLEIFDFLQDGPIKADFWRVCILFKYGGYYIDADIEPKEPISSFVDKDDYFVTCTSGTLNRKLNPHFIGCPANNIVVKTAMDTYIEMWSNPQKKYSYWGWSIVEILKFPFTFRRSTKFKYNHGYKYKFIMEKRNLQECVYNGVIVFNNRYKNYKNHNFEKPTIEDIKKSNSKISADDYVKVEI